MAKNNVRLSGQKIAVSGAMDKHNKIPVVIVEFHDSDVTLVLPAGDAVNLAGLLVRVAEKIIAEWDPILRDDTGIPPL